ncbi:hypothetical protein SNEBB_002557, partial [Seison nebaliae]
TTTIVTIDTTSIRTTAIRTTTIRTIITTSVTAIVVTTTTITTTSITTIIPTTTILTTTQFPCYTSVRGPAPSVAPPSNKPYEDVYSWNTGVLKIIDENGKEMVGFAFSNNTAIFPLHQGGSIDSNTRSLKYVVGECHIQEAGYVELQQSPYLPFYFINGIETRFIASDLNGYSFSKLGVLIFLDYIRQKEYILNNRQQGLVFSGTKNGGILLGLYYPLDTDCDFYKTCIETKTCGGFLMNKEDGILIQMVTSVEISSNKCQINVKGILPAVRVLEPQLIEDLNLVVDPNRLF